MHRIQQIACWSCASSRYDSYTDINAFSHLPNFQQHISHLLKTPQNMLYNKINFFGSSRGRFPYWSGILLKLCDSHSASLAQIIFPLTIRAISSSPIPILKHTYAKQGLLGTVAYSTQANQSIFRSVWQLHLGFLCDHDIHRQVLCLHRWRWL